MNSRSGVDFMKGKLLLGITMLSLFSFVVFFFIPSTFAVGTPHCIFGKVLTSEGIPPNKASLEIYAYNATKPDEILDKYSIGCGYDISFDGWLWFEIGIYSTPWSINDSLRIIVIDTERNESGVTDLVLNNSGSQLIPDLHLLPGDHVGPIASNTLVGGINPASIEEGTASVVLSAFIDDSLFGNNIIKKAEYFIDTDPGLGAGTTMNPSDGFFDSPMEEVTAYINTSSWEAGSTHTIYVRGQDSANNWGAAHSAVVSVIEPATGY